MTIIAVVRDGIIHPLEPLPSQWVEGKELIVEETEPVTSETLEHWTQDLETSIDRIPIDDQARFQDALSKIEHESKEAVRREWEQP